MISASEIFLHTHHFLVLSYVRYDAYPETLHTHSDHFSSSLFINQTFT